MRITARVATVASAGVTRIPTPISDLDECYDASRMTYDEGRLRKALSTVPGITFSSRDNKATLLFSIELLKQLESVTKQLNSKSEDGVDENGNSKSKNVTKGIRKLDRGERIGYIRISVDWASDHLRVSVSSSNPKGAVGAIDIFLRRYAMMCARTLIYLAKEFGKNHTRIELVNGEGCDGLFQEAADVNSWFDRRDSEIQRVRELNNKRFDCPHRHNEFCAALPDGTPPDFKCGCNCNGRCVEQKIPEEFN